MLYLDIAHLLRLRGINHPHSFLKNNGFTEHEIRHLINVEAKQITFEKLTRLCAVLKCTPNDLLYYNGDAHPHLLTLNEPEKPLITDLMSNLSPGELRTVNDMVANYVASVKK